jgi:hypothetical protein
MDTLQVLREWEDGIMYGEEKNKTLKGSFEKW